MPVKRAIPMRAREVQWALAEIDRILVSLRAGFSWVPPKTILARDVSGGPKGKGRQTAAAGVVIPVGPIPMFIGKCQDPVFGPVDVEDGSRRRPARMARKSVARRRK